MPFRQFALLMLGVFLGCLVAHLLLYWTQQSPYERIFDALYWQAVALLVVLVSYRFFCWDNS